MAIQICSYHALGEYPVDDDVHTLTFSEFEHQLYLIRQSGISCPKATPENWTRVSVPGKHCLGITFDDGCKSDLVAATHLARHGLSAMFFISTANIGRDGYLAEDEIRQLESMGMHVGSHSHEHIQLNTLPIDQAVEQMRLSKQRIEEVLGHSVETLAFPGGAYNRQISAAAREIGFRYQMTTDWGVTKIAENGNTVVIFRRDNILHGMKGEDFSRLITLKSHRHRQVAFLVKQAMRAVLPAQTYKKIRVAVAKLTV